MSMAGTDNLDDLNENLVTFQAALKASKVELSRPSIGTILLAIDGSNQDPTAVGLTTALARRLDVGVHLTYAYEGPRDEDRERYLVEQSKSFADLGRGVALSRAAGRSYEQILEVARAQACGLIVVCAPYLEDLTELGRESIGTNLDMLMSRTKAPLLVVREPKDDPKSCLRDLLLPLAEPTTEEPAAAGWALALLGDRGNLDLLIVADERAAQRAERLLAQTVEAETLEPELLDDLLAHEHAGLIAALQKQAAESGLGCRVLVRAGETVPVVTEFANESDRLIVLSSPQDRRSERYQRVLGILRESRNPVLIV